MKTNNATRARALAFRWRGGAFAPLPEEFRPPGSPDPCWPTVAIRAAYQRMLDEDRLYEFRLPRLGIPYLRPDDSPPAEWRERTAAIMATVPENDSDIFVRPAKTESPRHADLADRLRPLLYWARFRRRPSLLTTNWLQADNDEYAESGEPGRNVDRSHNYGPSPDALVKMAGKVQTPFRHARLGGGGATEHLPLYSERLGKLHFSVKGYSGTASPTRQQVYIHGSKRIVVDVPVPFGSLRFHDERPGELLGSEPDPAEVDRRREYWRRLMSYDREAMACRVFEPVRHIKAGRIRRKVMLTAADRAELLAGPLPPVKHCKPGLPCGAEDIGASFVGGWMSNTKGKPGVERWEDHADDLAARSEFESWLRSMSPDDVLALDAATSAQNFTAVGALFGKTGKAAERAGKARLLAANDNLAVVMAA